MRDNGSGDSGNDARAQRNAQISSGSHFLRNRISESQIATKIEFEKVNLWRFSERFVHHLSRFALDGKLGHSVRNLLEENGAKTSIETHDSISGDKLGQTFGQRLGKGGIRDGANTNSLEGTEKQVGDKLSTGSRDEVDSVAVLPGLFRTELFGNVDFEELDSSKLEPALDEISGGSGSETSAQHTDTLSLDNLAKSRDHAVLVRDGVQLHASLDHVDGADGSVRHRTAQSCVSSHEPSKEKKTKKKGATYLRPQPT